MICYHFHYRCHYSSYYRHRYEYHYIYHYGYYHRWQGTSVVRFILHVSFTTKSSPIHLDILSTQKCIK